MTKIASSTRELRTQLRASGLSMRALAKRAGVSDKTMRLFIDGGPSKAPTIEAIEMAFATPSGGTAHGASADVCH